MDEPYKNRELDYKFNEVHEKLDDIKKYLGSILEQTKVTNGRVTTVEIKSGSIGGGLKVMYGVIVLIILPLFWFMFNKLQSVNDSVIQLNATGRIIAGVSSSLIQK